MKDKVDFIYSVVFPASSAISEACLQAALDATGNENLGIEAVRLRVQRTAYDSAFRISENAAFIRTAYSAAARHASASSQVNEIAYKAALDAARVSHNEQYFDNEFRFPNASLPIQDMRSIACEAAKTVFTDETDISHALVIIFGVVNLQSAAKVRSADNAERSTPTNLVYDQLLRQAKAFAQELAKGAETDDPKLAEWFLLCDSLVARCAVVMSDEIFKNSKAYAIFGRRAIKRGLLNMMLNIAWTGKIAINTDLTTRKLVKAAVEKDSARAKCNMQADIEYLGKRRQDTH